MNENQARSLFDLNPASTLLKAQEKYRESNLKIKPEIRNYDVFLKRKENYQPNFITQSQHEFTIVERKILLYCINQIDFKTAQVGKNLEFKIPVRELDTNYSRLGEICKNISTKKMRSLDKDGFGVIVPFPEATYYIENGLAYLGLTMFSNVVPYFLDLKKAYTSYNFEVMLSLKSMYTQRILEIIMMEIKGRKKKAFTIFLDDLQFVLGSKYQNYADVQRRILKPAVEELAEKADLMVDYFVVGKRGRKVVEIQIGVCSKRQHLASELENDLYHWAVTNKENLLMTAEVYLKQYQFSYNQVLKILGDDKKLRKFMLLHTQIVGGELVGILNPTAYIAKSLGWGKK